MTDDLVERLRGVVGPQVSRDVTPFVSVKCTLIEEAADRIEELKKLCEELRLAHWHLSEALAKMTALALERKD